MNNIEYLISGILFLIVMFVNIHLYIYTKDLKLKIFCLETKIDILELKNKKYKFYIEICEFMFLEARTIPLESQHFLRETILKDISNNTDTLIYKCVDKVLISDIYRLIIRFNLKNNSLHCIDITLNSNESILTFKIKTK